MSAVKDEVLRKLSYIKKITGEAESLLTETEINPDNFNAMEMVQTLTEMVGVLLQQIKGGKSSEVTHVESRFKQIGKQYLDIKRAELALQMDEVDLDVLDGIKNRPVPGR